MAMIPPFLGREKFVSDVFLEDLIAQEERVVTLSHGGYVKAQSLSDYQAQRFD
jgi:DNA gyrase/topoisomerase IV subunit A